MRGDLALMLLQVYSYSFQNDVLLYFIEIFIIVGNKKSDSTDESLHNRLQHVIKLCDNAAVNWCT